jgi:hypothetical protein
MREKEVRRSRDNRDTRLSRKSFAERRPELMRLGVALGVVVGTVERFCRSELSRKAYRPRRDHRFEIFDNA